MAIPVMATPFRPSSERPGSRLRLRVSAEAERSLRSGHPWLFAQSIREQNRPGQLGELGIVYDRKNHFLAAGLFDPDSVIRLRVLEAGAPKPIDEAWWRLRLQRALAARAKLSDDNTTGFRWINGESDGWPALVLDRYNSTLVLKLYSGIWLPRLDEVAQLFREVLQPNRIVLRLSRNLQPTAESQFSTKDGVILHGPPVNGPVCFLENGLQFQADVVCGQKTGFFLDQRENRRAVERLAGGRRVLNAFSFSGGFSVYAARGGAGEVTDLDISAHALAAAQRNFELNRSLPDVGACRQERVQADAFDWLAGNPGRKFDLIILDPPSLAKREAERARAVGAYYRLAKLAVTHLEKRGVLLACSCSAHVSAAEFFEAVRRAVQGCGRRVAVLQTSAHASDHPATFPEAHYLKAIYLRIE
jgi:23S rRNA (cytosine1962-C5)-methyltransferase